MIIQVVRFSKPLLIKNLKEHLMELQRVNVNKFIL